MMGKYLNGYLERAATLADRPPPTCPPGWTEWDVAGCGYPEFDYTLNIERHLHRFGHAPAATTSPT